MRLKQTSGGYLQHEDLRASALANTEAHPGWQVHRRRALCPAIQHMAARLATHAVRVAVPCLVRGCRRRAACRDVFLKSV